MKNTNLPWWRCEETLHLGTRLGRQFWGLIPSRDSQSTVVAQYLSSISWREASIEDSQPGEKKTTDALLQLGKCLVYPLELSDTMALVIIPIYIWIPFIPSTWRGWSGWTNASWASKGKCKSRFTDYTKSHAHNMALIGALSSISGRAWCLICSHFRRSVALKVKGTWAYHSNQISV